MKNILCFGDSNTWGFIPGSDHKRYSKQDRWTGILSEMLGSSYEVIEEGLMEEVKTNTKKSLENTLNSLGYEKIDALCKKLRR